MANELNPAALRVVADAHPERTYEDIAEAVSDDIRWYWQPGYGWVQQPDPLTLEYFLANKGRAWRAFDHG